MKKPAVVLATAALMTLAACGGGSGTKSSEGNATMGEGGNAGSFKNADAKAPVAVPSDAAKGGTFTVLTNQVPSTLDPTQAYYVDSTAILSDLVLRSLTQYAYDAKTNDMQLIPDMATDLGRPSQDNKSWTFTLRDGLKYEDGTPVKAEDVAYAVKRSFAIAELPDGPTYQTTFFLDGDKYKGPFKDKGQYKGVVVKATTSPSRCVVRSPTWTTTPRSRRSPRSRRRRTTRRPTARSRWRPGPTSSPTTSRLRAQAGQERPVGPEHRPGPHPGRRRVGLQVRPGHRQARERHHQRPGLGADHADLRQREPVVVPLDLVGQEAPRDRHLAVHVHVVHRHDEDQGAPGPSGPGLGVPVRGGLEGRR
jgi:hypothetical protein